MYTMSISIASFISLNDASSRPNNSYVDVIAFVADIVPLDRDTFFPYRIRELTLKDDRCAFLLITQQSLI